MRPLAALAIATGLAVVTAAPQGGEAAAPLAGETAPGAKPQRIAVRAQGPARQADPAPPAGERDPNLAALDAHRTSCRQRGISRGADVGGAARLGVRLGSGNARAAGELTPEVEALLVQWDGWGAFVAAVMPGSPAEGAGIIGGDVIVQYAGLWVESHPVLQRLASRSELGREYEVKFIREGVLHSTWLFPAEL